MLPPLGRVLLVAGIALAAMGALILLAGRLPWLGRLPGDLTWRRGSTVVSFPLATSLLISIVLTIVVNLLLRRRG